MGKIRLIIAAIAVSLLLALAGSLDAQCNLGFTQEIGYGLHTIVANQSSIGYNDQCLPQSCESSFSGSQVILTTNDYHTSIYRVAEDSIPVRIIIWAQCDTVRLDTCVVLGGGDASMGLGSWFDLRFKSNYGDYMTIFSRENDTVTTYHKAVPTPQQPLGIKYILSELCNPTAIDTPRTNPMTETLTYIDLNGKIHTEQPVGFSYCPETRRKYWKFY